MPKPKHLTASSFDRLMSGYKQPGEFNKTAMAVVDRLAVELVGFQEDEDGEGEPGGARGWGIGNEWLALQAYAEDHLCEVRPAEFTTVPGYPFVGGTIDGLVGPEGGVEIKCPFNPIYHFDQRRQFETYEHQLQGYMWIFNLQWVDFVNFDPRFPESLQLIVTRIQRDEYTIGILKSRCQAAYDLAQGKAAQLLGGPK